MVSFIISSIYSISSILSNNNTSIISTNYEASFIISSNYKVSGFIYNIYTVLNNY